VVNIWTVEKGLDVVDVAVNQPCPALVAKCNEIAVSAEWTARYVANQALIQKLALAFGVPFSTVPDIGLVFDILRATKVRLLNCRCDVISFYFQAQGITIDGIDDAMYNAVEAASSWELRSLYNNDTVHRLASSQLASLILDVLTGAANGSGRLFTLYSAHDTTVAPLLSFLKVPWTVWPQYAATVYFGLLRDDSGALFVEVLHDRVPVSVAGLPMPAPFDQFVAFVQRSMVPNRQQACHAGPAVRSRKRAVDPEIAFLCGN
jgi:hypothetical protein